MPEPPVDSRGVRFAAAVTTVVLVLVLVTGSAWLLAAQVAVFALGAFAGLRFAPYSVAFRLLVAPRIGPSTAREDTAPVRFSQAVGFVFAAVGADRLRHRRHRARHRGHRARVGRRVPQRRLRLLPGLRAVRADRPSPYDVHQGSFRMSRQDVLVTADWAEKNLGTEGIVFLEVDEDTTAYDGGHLPGAVKINWTTELQDQVRRDIVDADQFAKLLSAKGVGNDDTVVLYGGNNNWFAAYAYWQFKLYGHGDVKLLDGGRKKWELDGRTLTSEVPDRPATTYTAQAPDTSIRAFRDEVVAAIGQKNLVDVRSPDEFSGKILAPAHLPQEQSQRPGHIPGAINIPWSKAANEDGTFKSDEELAKLYGEEGFDGSRATIAYCRIGERSSHTWVVLHELLGHGDVKNYDGSWTEYGSLIGVPIELGAGAKA